jgi:hypothetical protein
MKPNKNHQKLNMKIKYALAKNPKNKYQIHLKWMHGDADAYTNTMLEFNNEEKFLTRLELVRKFIKFNDNFYSDVSEKIRDKHPELFEGLNKKIVSFYDLLEYVTNGDYETDSTLDHQFYAKLYSISDIFYYDSDGVKYNVTVE